MKDWASPELQATRSLFEEILYYESSLLSSCNLHEWTKLLHDEIRYWIPVRINRKMDDEDLRRPTLTCHIDDDKRTLVYRAKRIEDGFGAADNPLPRIRHFVTNVRIIGSEHEWVDVTSNVMVWRSHVGLPDHQLVGGRNDRWVRNGGQWLLLERQVILDQDVVPGFGVLM